MSDKSSRIYALINSKKQKSKGSQSVSLGGFAAVIDEEMMVNKQLSLAVHLHLYYLDMWPEIRKYLTNIGNYPYDLFVTMTEHNSQLENEIKVFKPEANVLIVENRGYDVGPFIEFLHCIDLNKYDLLMKLHTKNINRGVDTLLDKYHFSRKLWFQTLIGALIGSPQIFQKNIKQFRKASGLGMIGSKYLITSNPICSTAVYSQAKNELDKLGYSGVPIKFVAGTMFMCRSKLLMPIKLHYTIRDFFPTDGRIKDGTLSHVLERVFGSLVIANNYKIRGFDHNYELLIGMIHNKSLQFVNQICRFTYQNKITKHHRRLIKVFKLPVYHRRIL